MLTVAITLDAATATLPLPLVLNTPLAVSALQTKPTSATAEKSTSKKKEQIKIRKIKEEN
jgi:hypothetical protein